MELEAISINGTVYPPEDSTVSAADRGLMFGHGAFETFRVANGKIFLLDEHFARLNKNLKALDIDWAYDQEKCLQRVKALSARIPADKDGRIRFCVTSGLKDGPPNVIIYLSLIDKFKPTEKKAQILQSIRRHRPEYFEAIGFRIKSLEYSYLYLAQKELPDDQTAGILLNPEGYVAEALTSNIFWAKDGTLFTPPLSLGILAGTMRDWIMEKLKVEERLAKQEELLAADEIFLSAGASYLTAIKQINDIPKPGVSGPFYDKTYQLLMEHFEEKPQRN